MLKKILIRKKELLFVLLTICIVLSASYKVQILTGVWVVTGILITLLLVLILIHNSLVFFKTLFKSSIGFSLWLFLTQQYCATPHDLYAGDESARYFLGLGLVAVVIFFIIDYTKALFAEKTEEEGVFTDLWKNESGLSRFFMTLIYVLIISLIFNTGSHALVPIVRSTCIL